MANKLRASSHINKGTDGIINLIKQVTYCNTIVLHPTQKDNVWDVHNGKGHVPHWCVILKGNRYRFEQID